MDTLADRLKMALGTAYELGPELGRGGMGAVFKANDRRLRRDVAIKVLPPEFGFSADYRTRFVREAQLAAGLSHPNIVPIYDVGDRDDLVWFVMAFVDGESVRAKVEREGPQPVSVVRRVLQEVAQALAYAHARGVVHRDIKPDNIMIDRATGRPLVTDFGIAKATEAGTELTRPGEIIGTARYMAPEQALAEGTVDGRADMYALGLVGYYMLTGTHAIKGTSLPAVIAEHVRGVHVQLGQQQRRLPQALVTAIERCLAADPAQRYARMEELSEALRELGGDLPDIPGPIRKLIRETERLFVLATFGMLGLGFVGVEHTPAALVLFLAGGLVGGWTFAIEQATRRGVTWSALRRAIYIERARRVEEVREGGSTAPGPVGIITMAGMFAGSLMLLAGTGQIFGHQPIDTMLSYLGLFGSLLVARSFGLSQAQRSALSRESAGGRRRRLALIMGLVVLGAAVVSIMRGAHGAKVALIIGVTAGAAGIGAAIGLTLQRRLRARAVEEQGEWKMPRVLDLLGSWLFGRFVRDGWRLRFERDRPAAVSDEAGTSAIQAALKRVRHLAGRVGPADRTSAGEALRLAEDLAAESRRAQRELRPLAAKLARLNEGVMISRASGGMTVESELDGVERDADRLRGQVKDYRSMLDALGTGLAAAVESADTAALDAALQRARELSSGVRRLTAS